MDMHGNEIMFNDGPFRINSQKAFYEYFSSTHDIEVLSTKWMEMSLKWKYPLAKIVSHLDTRKIGCEHF